MVIVCDNCGYFYDTDFDSVCPGCKNAPDIPKSDPVNSFMSFDFPAAEEPAAQEQYNMPMQEQFNPPVQEQFNPPVQEQFNPPVQEQINTPVQMQYEPPVQAQFAPPAIPEADSCQETAPVVKPANTKRCISCGKEIAESNAFCRYCGAPQVKKEDAPPAPVYRCISCSAEVNRPDSLCPDCEARAAAPVQAVVSPLFMEDNIILPAPKEPVIPEPVIEMPIVEEPVIAEPVAEEPVLSEEDFMAAPTIIVAPPVPEEVQEQLPEIPQPEPVPEPQPAANRCALCGKEVDNPDYLFCPYCGSALAGKSAPQPAQAPVQPIVEPVAVQAPVQQEAPPVYYPNLVPGQFMCENCGAVMNYGETMCGTCFAPVSSMKGVAAVTDVNAAPADNSEIIPERNPLSSFDYDNMVVPDFFAGDDSQM